MFSVRDSLCNRMEDEFNNHMDTLRKARELARDGMNALNNAIDSLVPTDDFNDLLNSVPDIGNVADQGVIDDLKNMIAQCTWLSGNMNFNDPTKILRGITGSMVDAAKALIGALAAPEIGVAMLMDTLKELFGVNGLNLKAVIEAMDKILNCLSAVCGRETSGMVNEMQSIMDELHLTDSGELDSNGILSDKGVSGQVLTNVENAQTKIKTAQDSIESQVKSIKIPGLL